MVHPSLSVWLDESSLTASNALREVPEGETMLPSDYCPRSMAFVAAMLMTGCVQPLVLKRYDGPDLPVTDVAIVHTYAPIPRNLSYVIEISQGGVEYYRYTPGTTRPNLTNVFLMPGDYEVILEGRCTSHYPLVQHKFTVTLVAGHAYEPGTAGCGFRGAWTDTFRMWLHDFTTGEDVTDSKGTLIPREEGLARH